MHSAPVIEFKKHGYAIVDNFLPEKVADELYDLYSRTEEWEIHDQVRENHYDHVFSTENPSLPKNDQPYLARFKWSTQLQESEAFQAIYNEYFKPAFCEVAGKEFTEFDNRCYRLDPGDFYRTHVDDWASELGGIYYVNKKWYWDWGGILMINDGEDSDFVETIFPKFNRMVFIDHGQFRYPHSISTVAEYATEPRFTSNSFCK